MRYAHQGDHRAAQLRMERAVRRTAEDGSEQQRCQVRFYEGFLAGLLGQRNKALQVMQPCFDRMLEMQWTQDAIGAGLQVMQNHLVLGQFTEAAAIGQRGLALTEKLKEHVWAARYAIDLGACFVFQDRDEQALPVFRKALEHALRAKSDHYYAFTISNLALIFYRKGWFQSAFHLFLDARNGFQDLKEPYWEALMHCNIAMTLCWQDGKAQEGLLHLEEAHRVRKVSGQPLPDDLKLDMALVHERFGNRKRAREMVLELQADARFNQRFVPGRQAWMGYLQLQSSLFPQALATLAHAFGECRARNLVAQWSMVFILLLRLGMERPQYRDDVATILERPLDNLTWLPAFLEGLAIGYWSVYQQVVLESAIRLFVQVGDTRLAKTYQDVLAALQARSREDDIQRMLSRFPSP